MQALGPRDTNRAADAAPQKLRAEGSKSNNVGVKRKRIVPNVDYTSTKRNPISFSYAEAARAQINIDFPMFFKTELSCYIASVLGS
jgi:hypothetical protein